MNIRKPRKVWAMKFVLWAIDDISTHPDSNDWDDQRVKAELIKRAKQYKDERITIGEAEIHEAVEALVDYFED